VSSSPSSARIPENDDGRAAPCSKEASESAAPAARSLRSAPQQSSPLHTLLCADDDIAAAASAAAVVATERASRVESMESKPSLECKAANCWAAAIDLAAALSLASASEAVLLLAPSLQMPLPWLSVAAHTVLTFIDWQGGGSARAVDRADSGAWDGSEVESMTVGWAPRSMRSLGLSCVAADGPGQALDLLGGRHRSAGIGGKVRSGGSRCLCVCVARGVPHLLLDPSNAFAAVRATLSTSSFAARGVAGGSFNALSPPPAAPDWLPSGVGGAVDADEGAKRNDP